MLSLRKVSICVLTTFVAFLFLVMFLGTKDTREALIETVPQKVQDIGNTFVFPTIEFPNFSIWVPEVIEPAAAAEVEHVHPVEEQPTYNAEGHTAYYPNDEEYLKCVIQRESHATYDINTGNGYYGAYQFLPSTWNATANHIGRYDLVGVLPHLASPADQDMMAAALVVWVGRGTGSFGGYCS